MLGKSTITLDRITDYNKQADGSWHGDLYRPIRLHVEGRSPDDCRYRMSDKFDAALSEWLERTQKQPGEALAGDAETATVQVSANNS